jgi:hypothetical protein
LENLAQLVGMGLAWFSGMPGDQHPLTGSGASKAPSFLV